MSEIENVTSKKLVLDHIKFLAQDKIPKDHKGNEYFLLHYIIEDYEILDELLNAFIVNKAFKGQLELQSTKFDDKLGYKIAQIIENNSLSLLKICNRNKPMSDRVSCYIGDALAKNSTLTVLEIFLDIGLYAPNHIGEFLANSESKLQKLNCLKINKKLFENFARQFNTDNKLKIVGFFYEPLNFVDLLYSNIIFLI